jgi:hypothetical protein
LQPIGFYRIEKTPEGLISAYEDNYHLHCGQHFFVNIAMELLTKNHKALPLREKSRNNSATYLQMLYLTISTN